MPSYHAGLTNRVDVYEGILDNYEALSVLGEGNVSFYSVQS